MSLSTTGGTTHVRMFMCLNMFMYRYVTAVYGHQDDNVESGRCYVSDLIRVVLVAAFLAPYSHRDL